MADSSNQANPEGRIVSASEYATKQVVLGEAEFRKGAQVMSTNMAAGFNPPSASLNPAASAVPRQQASDAAPAANTGAINAAATSPSSE